MVTAALFVKAPKSEQPACPSTDEQIKKKKKCSTDTQWNIILQEKGMKMCGKAWPNLEIVMHVEGAGHKRPPVVGCHLYEVCRGPLAATR